MLSFIRQRFAAFMFAGCFFSANLFLAIASAQAETWTDTTGKFSVEASFKGVVDASVVLEKVDGSVIRVPISRLSDESKRNAKLLFEQMRPATKPLSEQATTLHDEGKLIIPGYPLDSDLKTAMDFVSQQMQAGNVNVLWQLLPWEVRQLTQDKVVQQELVQLIEHYDAPLSSLDQLLTDLHSVLKNQREFVLGSAIGKSMKPDGKRHLTEHYDDFVMLVEAIRNIVQQRNQLGTLSLLKFTDQHGQIVLRHANRFLSGLPESIPAPTFFYTYDAKQASESAGTLTNPDAPSQVISMKRSQGYWVMTKMLDAMEGRDPANGTVREEVTDSLKMLNSEPLSLQTHQLVGFVEGFAGQALRRLGQAETQAEFDQVLGVLLASAIATGKIPLGGN